MNHHGKVSFSWKGDIFIADVQGPFNEEAVEHYIPLLKEAILKKKLSTWKRLEVWNDEMLASPAVITMAKEIYDWYDENGCIKTAIVLCNSLQIHMVKDMLNSNAEVFTESQKAQEWLDT